MKLSHRFVGCLFVFLFAGMAVHAQVPTSGAMLTINGTVGATPVNIVIYDSQIHSGVVQADLCDATGYITDAHVLQGGSLTGCDNGDAYEVTDGNANVPHQSPGIKDITKSAGQLAVSVTLPGTGFHIETHYCINGSICGATGVVGGNPWCNTSNTICASPDTGFLSVTNNTGSAFTGTITLQGNSPSAGGPWCPNAQVAGGPGVAFDQSVNLAAGASVALALGTAGFPSDTSNCGGFNFDQQAALLNFPLGPTVFQAHNDDFIVQCTNCNAGDTATWRPVPVPWNLVVNLPNPQKCITYADFSSPNALQPNGMCVLFQTHCLNDGVTCADAESFHWQGTYDYIIDANTIPNPIGGVHFLGDPGVNCAVNLTYTSDSGTSYTGAQPGVDPIPPQHSGSGGGLNCFVTTYDPTAPAIPIGVTFYAVTPPKPPLGAPPTVNDVTPGETVPIGFTLSTGAGGTGNPNYVLCKSGPVSSGSSTCGDVPALPAGTPWLNVSRYQVACPAAAAAPQVVIAQSDDLATNTGLQNQGSGVYLYNWKTSKTEPLQCWNLELSLSNGTTVDPFAIIRFKHP
jgi:hypothetical protein